jgi:hypothetical protein
MILNKQILIFIILAFILCFATVSLSAQRITDVKTASSPSTCEEVKHHLDYAIIDTNKINEATLILIFRLGRGESSAKLNKLRKANIEEYIKLRRLNHNYILAEGERNNGLSKVEIYVGGKLAWEIFIKKNKNIWDTCIE